MAWENQLEEKDFEELKLWLRKVLYGENPDPMPIMDDIVSYEYAEMAYINISRPAFQDRMERAVVDLFTKFNIEINNSITGLRYFANLIYIIARFKVVEAKKQLLATINTGDFINQPSQKSVLPFLAPDLQFLLLKVLLEFRNHENIEIFKRFFNEEKGIYAHICYRGLWECDRREGIEYLLDLARIYYKQKEKSFNFVLEFGFFLKEHFLFFLEEYDKVFPDRPATKLERGVQDLLKRAIDEFMRQSNLDIDIEFAFPPENKVCIVRIDPSNTNVYETVFTVSSLMSTVKLLVKSIFSQPTQIIPQSPYAYQPCDPNNMPCYKIAPAPSVFEVCHDAS